MVLRLGSASHIFAARMSLDRCLKANDERYRVRSKERVLCRGEINVAGWAHTVATERCNDVMIKSLIEVNGCFF